MRRFVIALSIVCLALPAWAAPPSDASIEKLLGLMKTQSTLDSILDLVQSQIAQSLQETFGGKPLTPQQQQVINQLPAKVMSSVKQDLSWDNVKPIYIAAFRDTFDQAEIDGISAFFASPAGQAYATKQSMLAQRTNAALEQKMQPMLVRAQAAVLAAIKEAGIPVGPGPGQGPAPAPSPAPAPR
jgi:hypothetical protein